MLLRLAEEVKQFDTIEGVWRCHALAVVAHVAGVGAAAHRDLILRVDNPDSRARTQRQRHAAFEWCFNHNT